MAKEKKRAKRSGLRLFFMTAWVSFCILILAAGFLIADYNTRRIGVCAEGRARFEYVRAGAFGPDTRFVRKMGGTCL